MSQSLAKINQKKSLLYFSGGITRDGMFVRPVTPLALLAWFA